LSETHCTPKKIDCGTDLSVAILLPLNSTPRGNDDLTIAAAVPGAAPAWKIWNSEWPEFYQNPIYRTAEFERELSKMRQSQVKFQ